VYTTCLFCHADLGSNEVIESFPVGRRLAFDAAQGRLWVVCRKCERWNLTPLEERWEAIEQCERLFSSTRLKVSTDNIGMSRLREGLELVRIGKPQRPEMAAWRYGDQFGRRRTRYVTYTVGAGVIVAGVFLGGPLLGFGSMMGGGWGLFQGTNALIRVVRDRVVRTRVAVPGFEQPATIRGKDIKRIVIGTDDEGLTLRFPFNTGVLEKADYPFVRNFDYPDQVTLRGEDAMRAAGKILPAVNIRGGKKEEIDAAVHIMEATPDPATLFARSTRLGSGISEKYIAARKRRSRRRPELAASEAFIDRIPAPMLLAMEMAAHEDVERRAMEGELAILEAAWKQAEEIAAISDNLLIPASIEAEAAALKSR
jgi:hypothetical protein